ncbi:MAG: ROK family protein [Muribaculaceae bacterium]|nr:ROK family protein [Muribaculaceae bacterium]
MNSKPYAIGIDIGGTNTVFGIVDRTGKVIAKGSIKTKGYSDFNEYLDRLYVALSSLIKENNAEGRIAGIGIGAPGANYHTGEIVNAANLNWGENLPIASLVSEKFGGLPVTVTNDANAATMGEMVYGAAKGMKDFMMITLGTGVGSGVVSNGQLVYGHDGLAGELGHVVVDRNGRKCGCGRKGCLETYCSSTGVVRTAREFLQRDSRPSLLRKLDPETITSKDVYDAAMEGDELAKEVFDFTGDMLGAALADFTAFSSPEAFILFGGLMRSGDLLMNPLKRSFDENLLFIYKEKPEILVSSLNEDDGAVLGASALAW